MNKVEQEVEVAFWEIEETRLESETLLGSEPCSNITPVP